MEHKFVEIIPEVMEKGIIYISIQYSTAVHLCVCGCGNEVVTPFSPTDWKFTFNGEAISLSPSIGNWSFQCKSHYWIRKGKIIHCSSWSDKKIKKGRKKDKSKKKKFFKKWKL